MNCNKMSMNKTYRPIKVMLKYLEKILKILKQPAVCDQLSQDEVAEQNAI